MPPLLSFLSIRKTIIYNDYLFHVDLWKLFSSSLKIPVFSMVFEEIHMHFSPAWQQHWNFK